MKSRGRSMLLAVLLLMLVADLHGGITPPAAVAHRATPSEQTSWPVRQPPRPARHARPRVHPLGHPVFGSGQDTRPAAVSRRRLAHRPNIVEVLADDMRVDDLKYAPNLRNLIARNGIAMQNAFSSYPLCCPARASFFSGMLPHNHHVYSIAAPYGYRAFDDRSTLATALHAAGYTTGLTGKYLNAYGSDVALAPALAWRHRPAGRRTPPQVLSQYYVPDGWDQWRAAIQGPWCRPACGGTYHYFKYAYSDNGRPRATRLGAYSSNVIGTQSLQLERRFHRVRRRTGRPFFLSVNFVAPHSGINDLTKRTRSNAGGDTATDSPISLPAAPAAAFRTPLIRSIRHGSGVLPDGTTEPDVSDKPGRWATYRELTPAMDQAVAADTRARAAAVYVMDKNIGRLVHRLKASGEWRRTIFVFWSDNGYFQGEHHRPSGKVFAYEPVVRVPMLITGPGMRGGAHTGAYGGQDRFDPMTVVDLSRTVVDWAHARPPHRMDGASMVRTLTHQDLGWRQVVPVEGASGVSPRMPGDTTRDPGFAALGRTTTGIVKPIRNGLVDPRNYIGFRTGQWLYVRYDDAEAEIYDLWADPEEWDNLAADQAWMRDHAGFVATLNQVWNAVKNCTGDACHAPLPPGLQVSASSNRAHTRAYWAAMARRYDY